MKRRVYKPGDTIYNEKHGKFICISVSRNKDIAFFENTETKKQFGIHKDNYNKNSFELIKDDKGTDNH